MQRRVSRCGREPSQAVDGRVPGRGRVGFLASEGLACFAPSAWVAARAALRRACAVVCLPSAGA
jgi:hypothetical protein